MHSIVLYTAPRSEAVVLIGESSRGRWPQRSAALRGVSPCESTLLGVPLAREATLRRATQLGALSEAYEIRLPNPQLSKRDLSTLAGNLVLRISPQSEYTSLRPPVNRLESPVLGELLDSTYAEIERI